MLSQSIAGQPLQANFDPRSRIACQFFPWFSFAQRHGFELLESETAIRQTARTGIPGFEGNAQSAEQMARIVSASRAVGLQLRSVYSNLRLHETTTCDREMAMGFEIARIAQSAGVEIYVVNPEPIRWGGQDNKSDSQLELQRQNLEKFGKRCQALGITLAYHNHDAEMRMGARELHHMLAGTDPTLVYFCFDLHSVFRGSGDSMLAVKDIWKLYRQRVVELHLRQSQNGIYTQTFGQGDIDYAWMAQQVQTSDTEIHLVLEQSIEEKSSVTMSDVEAHAKSFDFAERLFNQ